MSVTCFMFLVDTAFKCINHLLHLLFPLLGDTVCGVCVFHRWLQIPIYCSHRAGVCDHCSSAAAVSVQTQQEADLCLLASDCELVFAAQQASLDLA